VHSDDWQDPVRQKQGLRGELRSHILYDCFNIIFISHFVSSQHLHLNIYRYIKHTYTAITVSALLAALVALIVTIAVAVPLALLSRDLDERIVELIEGISKLVAAVCILQLSLKIPKFLGVYASKKGDDGRTIGLSLQSIRFNVAWNIWREMAEIGVFLIPFFLGEGAIAIPLSGLAGIAVGAMLGGLIYYANKAMKNKIWLAAFMAILLLMLSVGLFTMGW
jgi:high-affinity iron transporter